VRSTELGQVVEAAVEIVRPAADAKGVLLERVPSPAVTFEGDPDRLQQVVWNLLSNAVKFTPAGGTVRVRLARIGETIALTVTDSGEGIAADLLPHVFERFRQGDAGVDRAHGGLGLGLAVVKHLVEAHGGSVDAFSAGPGSGATFTVQLPAAVPRRAGEQETVSRA
jgi:signal transduction histidine kinase